MFVLKCSCLKKHAPQKTQIGLNNRNKYIVKVNSISISPFILTIFVKFSCWQELLTRTAVVDTDTCSWSVLGRRMNVKVTSKTKNIRNKPNTSNLTYTNTTFWVSNVYKVMYLFLARIIYHSKAILNFKISIQQSRTI